MILNLSPDAMQRFRKTTADSTPVSKQIKCPACGKRKSYRQFSLAATKCKQCVKRISKTTWMIHGFPDKTGVYEVEENSFMHWNGRFWGWREDTIHRAWLSRYHPTISQYVVYRGLSEQP